MRKIIYLLAFLFTCGMTADAQLKVNSGGLVGINNATPTAQLHINSSAAGDFVLRATASGANTLFEVQEGGVGAGNFFVYNAAGTRTIQFAGQGKFYISSPGNLGVDQQNPSFDFEIGTEQGGGGTAAKPGGGMWAATSDRRSKSSVDEYTKGIDELMKVNPVSYTYNGRFGTPAGGEYVGVVAQELKEVVPSMVMDRKYNTASLEQIESASYDASQYEEEFLAVDPSEFLYMLINATKEQQAVIDDLKAQLEDLSAELEDIKEATKVGSTDVDNKHEKDVVLNGDTDVASLAQNQPNPFNENTIIKYFIPEGSTGAQMNIFSSEGRILKTIKIDEAGNGQINLRANSLPAGNYMYQLTTDAGVVGSKTMVLVK